MHESSSRQHLPSSNREENDNWITADGFYENGKIIATVPKLDHFDPEYMAYSVDVALNG
jgi:hypothetical protein